MDTLRLQLKTAQKKIHCHIEVNTMSKLIVEMEINGIPDCCGLCDPLFTVVCATKHDQTIDKMMLRVGRPSWCPIKGELVRCGECNRHEEPRDTCLKAFIWCNLYNTHKLKDGYCNCGERKDGEE